MILEEAVIKERIATVDHPNGKSFLMPWIEFTEPGTGFSASIFKADFKEASTSDPGLHHFVHIFSFERGICIDLHYQDPEERNLALIMLKGLL